MVMDPQEYYAKANLTDNPFRSTPNFASDPRARIWVGYEKQKKQLDKYLTRSLCDQVGNMNFLMLYGDYGTGKSHALLWAQNKILHDKKNEFNSVCYFIPTLRKDKGKLTFAGAFQDDIVEKSNLLADAQAYHNFLVECISAYRVEKNLGHDVEPEKVIEYLIPAVEMSNFAKEIFHCQRPEDYSGVLVPKSLTDYQAMMIFTRLVNLFVNKMRISDTDVRRFKNGAYLFIDELDDLQRASVKEARDVNDILRHIYDNCPSCFCMIIALSAEISQLTAIFFDYILSRIHRQIELVVLDKDDAVKFVLEILENSRVDSDGEGDFFPFEEAAINSIASDLTEITPRKIVTTMQQIIEEARLAGHDPAESRITIDFLDEHDIIEEVLGEH
jgi:DNA polymerase III delta prime subunit